MDRTKKYILQCEKAPEIQRLWKPEEGDWFGYKDTMNELEVIAVACLGHYQPPSDDGRRYFYDSGCGCCSDDKEGELWLPRQDQLQEMIINKSLKQPVAGLIWDFSAFADPSYDVHKYCKSMEQLWLAFVMHERFGKHWSGKDWEPK